MWSNHVCSSDIDEALGLSHAIHWLCDLQLTNMDFGLDAKEVVDYYNRGSNDISEFGAIIDECMRCCNYFLNTLRLSLSRHKRIKSLTLLHERPFS